MILTSGRVSHRLPSLVGRPSPHGRVPISSPITRDFKGMGGQIGNLGEITKHLVAFRGP